MGAIGSKDTRRISFDNTFAFNTALAVQKSIQDEHDVLDIESITVVTETKDELLFPDTNKNKCLDLEKHDCETDYWGNRIDYLKKEHRVINKIIESEYEKTLENTSKLLEPGRITQERMDKMKSCFELRNKILHCYEENRHQPLVCAPLVQAFSHCVSTCSFNR